MSDDKPVDINDIFNGLFGPDTRTPEERERDDADVSKDAAKYDERRNEGFKEQFERAKEQRERSLAEEARIRKIVTEEQNKFFLMLCTWVAAGYLGYQYGTWAFFTTGLVVWAWQWNSDRKANLKPEYKLDQIDDLAENTVTHERIVEMESSNRSWITLDDEYGPECENVFDHPYWSRVNAKVREYRWKSHKERLADNAAARAASLPFRKAKLTHIQSINAKWELPCWCNIRHDEGGKD